MNKEKSEKKKKSGWRWFLIGSLIGLLVIALLALVPIGQLLLIKWMDLDSFRALVGRGSQELDVRFYQFVLSAITILIAIGAVLLYRERKDITEQKEKLEETCTEATEDYNKIKAISEPMLQTLVELQKSVSETQAAIAEIKISRVTAREDQAVIAEVIAVAVNDARKIEEIYSRISIKQTPELKEPDIKDTKKRAAWELTQEGVNLLKEKNYPEGEAKFRAALALDPDFAATHYNLGVVLWQKGETDEAIKELREAIRLQPDAAEAHYNLACCYALQGKKEVALKSLAQAVDKGFDEWPHMEKDEDLKSLRDDSGFKELAEKVKAWWEEKEKKEGKGK
jgi:tetratricopeptide (TPR) repeat protein